MRILFVADGRSPITHGWLRAWIEAQDEVHLVSTFPCERPAGLASFHVLPVAFAGLGGGQAAPAGSRKRTAGPVGRLRGRLRLLRYWAGPLSLPPHQARFRRLAVEIAPDLVHALRLPFEGMLAAAAPPGIPLVVSIWGNDLTLHARGSFLMAAWTRRTLRRAFGLLADARRDIRLGREWGFSGPTLVVPGGGGIRMDEIRTAASGAEALPEAFPDDWRLVVNPRGARPGSLRNDVFFQAIPRVLDQISQACFVCPPLAGDAEAEKWVKRLGIAPRTRLWPQLTQPQLWRLLAKAQVYVSPSVHDGTPNSLLEAMACGCFPVVGNIESLREWITSGENGLLADATDPGALAEALIAALSDPDLRRRAANENARLVAERADNRRCMAQARAFYERTVAGRNLLPQEKAANPSGIP
jgi:glycosyltransferase involved in cell wall biosynthesis